MSLQTQSWYDHCVVDLHIGCFSRMIGLLSWFFASMPRVPQRSLVFDECVSRHCMMRLPIVVVYVQVAGLKPLAI